MKQQYIPKRFTVPVLSLIHRIDAIIVEYQKQGFMLTVRQLYYQLVARGVISNTLQEYKRVAGIINDAKLSGDLDWDAIEDRTRDFVRQQRWDDGAHILRACVSSYHEDMWTTQENRVFVIVEKEALVGVLERACRDFDVPLLAARGYPSGTVLRAFAQSDLIAAIENNQRPVILHLGDHDPSGIDMSRDLEERLTLFTEEAGGGLTLDRIALTMAQINQLKPPENPAKQTDARFESYYKNYGDKSWELDALSPTYLDNLLRTEISLYVDDSAWEKRVKEVDKVKKRILEMSKEFK